ncbi:hypothetical protein O2N63_00465 [Aliiroseovarius sp. KMU-50]|uniref:Uncharacterized protein n=1 Tax=Aliiroseovarius salicola TaxID=3009082 RepID=A0ABT4VWE9_9RHOB|nr:hypothetical protein [Aliiroseovarius sp. KMU-50]MDA5092562.1 hypothetical protein [Aliiroseovarius sp. KMU-50]
MRRAIFAIAALNFVWFFALAFDPPNFPDVAGQGWITLIGLILAAFHIPALILAVNRKAEWLALSLVLIPLIYYLNGVIQGAVS